VESLARIFLLMLAVALLLQLAAGGWPAVFAWFRAKFIGG
jgi:hypothetical protein